MPFDFKKAEKALYLPGARPALVEVPAMRFVAVAGKGDPNALNGDYQKALAVLYAVAYAIRMSKLGERRIEGYFDYVVPPLEGFWRQPGVEGVDFSRKDRFEWLSAIRLPDFVTGADFDWAVAEAGRKKKLDCSAARRVEIEEGLCAQCMHTGPYDDEPATIARLEAFIEDSGCVPDYADARRHHEIYLTDPRRTPPERMKTVLRIPVKRRIGGES